MNFRKVILMMLPAVLAFQVSAQNDPKATQILNKVSKLYKSYSTIKSTFTVTTTSAQGKSTPATSGTVWIKGNKYRLDYAGQEIYCDGKFIWTYNKDDKEVTKEVFKVKDNAITPNEIFTIYNRDFKSVFEGPIVKNGKTFDAVKLVPKKKVNYSYLKLEIDRNTSKIARMIQHFKNGTEISYAIGTFTPNTAIGDNFFQWNPAANPGVSLVDLTK
jgi:outer membrane lipoprotein carrier protein